jgi:hypothetical protein
VNRRHPNWQSLLDSSVVSMLDSSGVGIDEDDSANIGGGEDMGYCLSPVLSIENSVMPPISGSTLIRDSKKFAAQLLLALKEHHRLTQNTVDYTVVAVNDIIEGIRKDIKQSVSQIYEENPMPTIDDIVGSIDLMESPFVELRTEYQQTAYYLDHLGLVVSMRCSYPYTSNLGVGACPLGLCQIIMCPL